jgi:hypothetical protein
MVSTRAALTWTLLPPLLAIWCLALAPLCPQATVGGEMALALLISAPPWLLLLWPLWALLGQRRIRSWAYFWPSLLGLLLVGLPLSPRGLPEGQGLLIVSTNVNSYSPEQDPANLQGFLGGLRADVILVIEKRAMEIPGMRRVADNFLDELPRISHGTAIFCREGLDCPAEVTAEFGHPDSKMPLGLLRLGRVCVMAIHSPPPLPYNALGMGPYIQRIVGYIEDGRMGKAWGPCEAGDGLLVMGDLNHVPYSPAHQRLLSRGLRDPLALTGLFGASWPSGGGWPNFPFFRLDHVLVGQVDVSTVHTLRVPATDHLARALRLR